MAGAFSLEARFRQHVVGLPRIVPRQRRYLGEPDAKDAVVSTRHVLMRAAVTGKQHVGSHLDASTVEVETLGVTPAISLSRMQRE